MDEDQVQLATRGIARIQLQNPDAPEPPRLSDPRRSEPQQLQKQQSTPAKHAHAVKGTPPATQTAPGNGDQTFHKEFMHALYELRSLIWPLSEALVRELDAILAPAWRSIDRELVILQAELAQLQSQLSRIERDNNNGGSEGKKKQKRHFLPIEVLDMRENLNELQISKANLEQCKIHFLGSLTLLVCNLANQHRLDINTSVSSAAVLSPDATAASSSSSTTSFSTSSNALPSANAPQSKDATAISVDSNILQQKKTAMVECLKHLIQVEVRIFQERYPISFIRDELYESLLQNSTLMLTAETGAGKSTLLPCFLAIGMACGTFAPSSSFETWCHQDVPSEQLRSSIHCSTHDVQQYRRDLIFITSPRPYAAVRIKERIEYFVGAGLVSFWEEAHVLEHAERIVDPLSRKNQKQRSHKNNNQNSSKKQHGSISQNIIDHFPLIVILTEQAILRLLGCYPSLPFAKFVILDEAHERTAIMDCLISLLTGAAERQPSASLQDEDQESSDCNAADNIKRRSFKKHAGSDIRTDPSPFPSLSSEILSSVSSAKYKLSPECKLIITSATINMEALKNYLPHAASLYCPGRTFPIEDIENPIMHHSGASYSDTALVDHVASAAADILRDYVSEAIAQDEDFQTYGQYFSANNIGNFLVFLPGSTDCERACALFKKYCTERARSLSSKIFLLQNRVPLTADVAEWEKDVQMQINEHHQLQLRQTMNVNRPQRQQQHHHQNRKALPSSTKKDFLPIAVLPLYGKLPTEAQDWSTGGHLPNVMRIIFATNIAETSVTIPNISLVIDSRLQKTSFYVQERSATVLRLEVVSGSSAKQRRGRAGRQRPGRYFYFTWPSEARFPEYNEDEPEICRSDLGQLILKFRLLNLPLENLNLPKRPSAAHFQSCLHQLVSFGALHANPNSSSSAKKRNQVMKKNTNPSSTSSSSYSMNISGTAANKKQGKHIGNDEVEDESSNDISEDKDKESFSIWSKQVTDLGRRIASLPVSVPLSVAFLDSADRGFSLYAAAAVACISVGSNILFWGSLLEDIEERAKNLERHAAFHDKASDISMLATLFLSWYRSKFSKKFAVDNSLNLRQATLARDIFLSLLSYGTAGPSSSKGKNFSALHRKHHDSQDDLEMLDIMLSEEADCLESSTSVHKGSKPSLLQRARDFVNSRLVSIYSHMAQRAVLCGGFIKKDGSVGLYYAPMQTPTDVYILQRPGLTVHNLTHSSISQEIVFLERIICESTPSNTENASKKNKSILGPSFDRHIGYLSLSIQIPNTGLSDGFSIDNGHERVKNNHQDKGKQPAIDDSENETYNFTFSAPFGQAESSSAIQKQKQADRVTWKCLNLDTCLAQLEQELAMQNHNDSACNPALILRDIKRSLTASATRTFMNLFPWCSYFIMFYEPPDHERSDEDNISIFTDPPNHDASTATSSSRTKKDGKSNSVHIGTGDGVGNDSKDEDRNMNKYKNENVDGNTSGINEDDLIDDDDDPSKILSDEQNDDVFANGNPLPAKQFWFLVPLDGNQASAWERNDHKRGNRKKGNNQNSQSESNRNRGHGSTSSSTTLSSLEQIWPALVTMFIKYLLCIAKRPNAGDVFVNNVPYEGQKVLLGPGGCVLDVRLASEDGDRKSWDWTIPLTVEQLQKFLLEGLSGFNTSFWPSFGFGIHDIHRHHLRSSSTDLELQVRSEDMFKALQVACGIRSVAEEATEAAAAATASKNALNSVLNRTLWSNIQYSYIMVAGPQCCTLLSLGDEPFPMRAFYPFSFTQLGSIYTSVFNMNWASIMKILAASADVQRAIANLDGSLVPNVNYATRVRGEGPFTYKLPKQIVLSSRKRDRVILSKGEQEKRHQYLQQIIQQAVSSDLCSDINSSTAVDLIWGINPTNLDTIKRPNPDPWDSIKKRTKALQFRSMLITSLGEASKDSVRVVFEPSVPITAQEADVVLKRIENAIKYFDEKDKNEITYHTRGYVVDVALNTTLRLDIPVCVEHLLPRLLDPFGFTLTVKLDSPGRNAATRQRRHGHGSALDDTGNVSYVSEQPWKQLLLRSISEDALKRAALLVRQVSRPRPLPLLPCVQGYLQSLVVNELMLGNQLRKIPLTSFKEGSHHAKVSHNNKGKYEAPSSPSPSTSSSSSSSASSSSTSSTSSSSSSSSFPSSKSSILSSVLPLLNLPTLNSNNSSQANTTSTVSTTPTASSVSATSNAPTSNALTMPSVPSQSDSGKPFYKIPEMEGFSKGTARLMELVEKSVPNIYANTFSLEFARENGDSLNVSSYLYASDKVADSASVEALIALEIIVHSEFGWQEVQGISRFLLRILRSFLYRRNLIKNDRHDDDSSSRKNSSNHSHNKLVASVPNHNTRAVLPDFLKSLLPQKHHTTVLRLIEKLLAQWLKSPFYAFHVYDSRNENIMTNNSNKSNAHRNGWDRLLIKDVVLTCQTSHHAAIIEIVIALETLLTNISEEMIAGGTSPEELLKANDKKSNNYNKSPTNGLDSEAAALISCLYVCDGDYQPLQLPCSHYLCAECVCIEVRDRIKRKNSGDVGPMQSRCIHCQAWISASAIRSCLQMCGQTLLFDSWASAEATIYLAAKKASIMACPSPNCGRFMHLHEASSSSSSSSSLSAAAAVSAPDYELKEGIYTQCRSCGVRVCRSCKQLAHDGKTCNGQEIIVTLPTGYRRCPNLKCKLPTERIDGCNHIICQCGCHYCWACGFVGSSAEEVYRHMNTACGRV